METVPIGKLSVIYRYMDLFLSFYSIGAKGSMLYLIIGRKAAAGHVALHPIIYFI